MKQAVFQYFEGKITRKLPHKGGETLPYGAWHVLAKSPKKAKGKFIRHGIIPK